MPSCPTDAALLRRCLPSGVGAGSGVLLLAVAGAAAAGGHGLRTQPVEHPWGLLPRRPRVRGLPADAGQHQRRTVRQLPAAAAVAASPDRTSSSCTWTGHATTAAPLSRSGCDGIREFPAVEDPRVLAQCQPDRARVEVSACESIVPVAQDPFEDMQAAVSEVLDHLEDYRGELRTLMTEKFHIIDKQDIPVQYREVTLDHSSEVQGTEPADPRQHTLQRCRISRRCSVPARRPRHSHSAMRNRRFHLFLPPIGSPPATVYHRVARVASVFIDPEVPYALRGGTSTAS